jgi:hypothetical protein
MSSRRTVGTIAIALVVVAAAVALLAWTLPEYATPATFEALQRAKP